MLVSFLSIDRSSSTGTEEHHHHHEHTLSAYEQVASQFSAEEQKNYQRFLTTFVGEIK